VEYRRARFGGAGHCVLSMVHSRAHARHPRAQQYRVAGLSVELLSKKSERQSRLVPPRIHFFGEAR
jgi:hypothetical protein